MMSFVNLNHPPLTIICSIKWHYCFQSISCSSVGPCGIRPDITVLALTGRENWTKLLTYHVKPTLHIACITEDICPESIQWQPRNALYMTQNDSFFINKITVESLLARPRIANGLAKGSESFLETQWQISRMDVSGEFWGRFGPSFRATKSCSTA